MEMIQKETFKQWFIETNKPDSQKDKRLILSLVAELRANNQQLTSLGMVTPIIATIKNIIDEKDKNRDKKMDNPTTQQFIHNYPIYYKIHREDEEDDIDITETNDTFNKQSTTGRSSIIKENGDTNGSIKEYDPNRKF